LCAKTICGVFMHHVTCKLGAAAAGEDDDDDDNESPPVSPRARKRQVNNKKGSHTLVRDAVCVL
jgi:hypothetical protein